MSKRGDIWHVVRAEHPDWTQQQVDEETKRRGGTVSAGGGPVRSGKWSYQRRGHLKAVSDDSQKITATVAAGEVWVRADALHLLAKRFRKLSEQADKARDLLIEIDVLGGALARTLTEIATAAENVKKEKKS